MTRTVDLDSLPEAQKQRGLALVQAAHVFDRPAKILLPSPHPWDFNYVLEAQDGAHSHRIQFHLDAADGALRALAAWMEAPGG